MFSFRCRWFTFDRSLLLIINNSDWERRCTSVCRCVQCCFVDDQLILVNLLWLITRLNKTKKDKRSKDVWRSIQLIVCRRCFYLNCWDLSISKEGVDNLVQLDLWSSMIRNQVQNRRTSLTNVDRLITRDRRRAAKNTATREMCEKIMTFIYERACHLIDDDMLNNKKIIEFINKTEFLSFGRVLRVRKSVFITIAGSGFIHLQNRTEIKKSFCSVNLSLSILWRWAKANDILRVDVSKIFSRQFSSVDRRVCLSTPIINKAEPSTDTSKIDETTKRKERKEFFIFNKRFRKKENFHFISSIFDVFDIFRKEFFRKPVENPEQISYKSQD